MRDDHAELTPGSRLPADPAYWDDLAGRIAARSAPDIEAWGARRAPWWSWMADFAPALAVAAVLMLAWTWAFAPPAPAGPGLMIPAVAQVITLDDPLARALLADSMPPAIATLSWADTDDGGSP